MVSFASGGRKDVIQSQTQPLCWHHPAPQQVRDSSNNTDSNNSNRANISIYRNTNSDNKDSRANISIYRNTNSDSSSN